MAAGFFDALSAASGVPKQRIFCIPGNHNINRKRQKLALLARAPRSRPEPHRCPSGAVIARRPRTLLQREEGYRAFQASYFTGQDRAVTEEGLAYVSRLVKEDVQIAIVGLDSAWLAEGGMRTMASCFSAAPGDQRAQAGV